MKPKSLFILFTGIAIGSFATFFIIPRKSLKSRRQLSKKSRKYNKAFKETASRYKQKLSEL